MQTVAEACEVLRQAVMSECEADDVRFTFIVTYEECEVKWDKRTAESLKADGVSMRNISGQWIRLSA